MPNDKLIALRISSNMLEQLDKKFKKLNPNIESNQSQQIKTAIKKYINKESK